MSFVYLIALAVSLFGMGVIDRKYKLAMFKDPRRTSLVLLLSVAVFVVWDMAGISLGIFFNGDSPFDTGLMLAPELPIEELFFLTLLCYVSLLSYLFVRQKAGRS